MDYPRIHFKGNYYANAATLNNVQENYQLSLPREKMDLAWNPTGGNEWALMGCSVTSVVYSNGTKTSDKNKDPLIGAAVNSNPFSVEGKLACFDVEAWNKSALYGATLGIKQSSTSDKYGLLGSWLPKSVVHQNAWIQEPCMTKNHNQLNLDDKQGARTASKLVNVTWASSLYSEALQQLKQISEKHGGQLSISMSLYAFRYNETAANYSQGRISGTIGFARMSEPRFFEGERLISFEFVDQPNLTLSENDQCYTRNYHPVWAYRAIFKLHHQTKSITVDFSSTFTRDMYQSIRDLGLVHLAVLRTDNGSLCVDTMDAIDYHDDKCRTINGCVMDFNLSDYHYALVQEYPLTVVMPLKDSLAPTNTTYPICGKPTSNCRVSSKTFNYADCMVALMLEKWYYVRPYNYYTFILEKGDVAIVDLYVTFLGRPAIGTTIQVSPLNPTTEPTDGLNYTHEAKVGQDGCARFLFRAKSIQMPRKQYDIDGQVYFFMYYVKGEPRYCAGDLKHSIGSTSEIHTCIDVISIKVYSDISYENTSQFTWIDHVEPIFLQYARLYPTMERAVNLSNYASVTQPYIINMINFSMQLDINHPSYMPVSRELSSAKRKMIMEWLTKPCYNSSHCFIDTEESNSKNETSNITMNAYVREKINKLCTSGGSFHEQPQDLNQYYEYTANTQSDVNGQSIDCITQLNQSVCSVYMIQYCLQKALELEFYTIPLYLTALYSIKGSHNTAVKNIIRSIVMQEMLHMLQASNILISIGGTPIIDSASTAPAYPATGLPGGVFPHLTVSLRKASIDQIYGVFMAIEYPHKVVDTELTIDTVHSKTIGQLYAEIKKCLKFHGDTIFYANRTSLQVKWPYDNDYGNIYVVYDLATAMEGIKEITEQGEGTQPGDPHSFDREDLAHFFKFQEIVCGKELVFHGVSNYTYTGDPIPFNESGIWPMRDNPSISGLVPTSLAYYKAKIFHDTYRSLLWQLDRVMAGHPEELSAAIPVMTSLEFQAKALMDIPFSLSGSEFCGPVFDYYWNEK